MNQLAVEVGGDVDQLERWDPNPREHSSLLNELGGRVTEAAPLRFLLIEEVTASDVSRQQARFVFSRKVVQDYIVRCLTIQQRHDLCNNGAPIQIAGFDEGGRQWELKLKKRMQSGPDTGTYVLKRDWTEMVKANGWKGGDDKIKIWGLPLARREDLWRSVFTTTV